MKLSYVDKFGDGERHEMNATVTTEHSASSYGQPVIVLESDGEALDLMSWLLLEYKVIEATPKELKLLKQVFTIDESTLAANMGRRGGSKTSEAKKKSSAANGKLGGRPRKKTE